MYINLPIEKIEIKDIMHSNRTLYLKRVQALNNRLTDLSNYLFDTPFETLCILHNIKTTNDLSIYSDLFSDFKISNLFDLRVSFSYNTFGCIQYASFKGEAEAISVKIQLFIDWMEKEKEEITNLRQEYEDYANGLITDI